jgi:hypothetical protein
LAAPRATERAQDSRPRANREATDRGALFLHVTATCTAFADGGGLHARLRSRGRHEGEQPHKFPHGNSLTQPSNLAVCVRHTPPCRSHIPLLALPGGPFVQNENFLTRLVAFENRTSSERRVHEISILRIFSDVGSPFSGNFRSQRRWVGNDRYGLRKGCNGAKRLASE